MAGDYPVSLDDNAALLRMAAVSVEENPMHQFGAVQLADRLRALAVLVPRYEAALRQIIAKREMCIYSHTPAFRDGSNRAFVECAEIAQDALDAGEETTHG